MKRYLIIIFLFISSFLTAENETYFLKDRLKDAKAGEYLVLSHNENYILIHIHSRLKESLLIEELTIPVHSFRQLETNWKDWLEDLEGEDATSWLLYEIDIETAKMRNWYSQKDRAFLDIEQSEAMLSRLLSIPFEKETGHDRWKAGKPPLSGKDKRPTWNPEVRYQGISQKGVSCMQLKGYWPDDHSDISGKKIYAFVPDVEQKYPSYFPYYIQIGVAATRQLIVAQDSGAGLKSPVVGIPFH